MKYEEELIAKGLTGPRITQAHVEREIKEEMYHVFPGTEVTVCCLKLQNDYTVVGMSACASPENFDAEMGRKISRDKAAQEIWTLEAYLLKERLSKEEKIEYAEERPSKEEKIEYAVVPLSGLK